MSDIVTTNIRDAGAAVAVLERDMTVIAAARADLTSRLPTLRAERTQAAMRCYLRPGLARLGGRVAGRAGSRGDAGRHGGTGRPS
jgi:hypothetical protein